MVAVVAEALLFDPMTLAVFHFGGLGARAWWGGVERPIMFVGHLQRLRRPRLDAPKPQSLKASKAHEAPAKTKTGPRQEQECHPRTTHGTAAGGRLVGLTGAGVVGFSMNTGRVALTSPSCHISSPSLGSLSSFATS